MTGKLKQKKTKKDSRIVNSRFKKIFLCTLSKINSLIFQLKTLTSEVEVTSIANVEIHIGDLGDRI